MKLSDFIKSVPNEFANIELNGITNDSRNVKSGYAFVCIVGSASDGHDYAEKALQNGASVIIAERDIGIKNQVIVADTHRAYADGCAALCREPVEKISERSLQGKCQKVIKQGTADNSNCAVLRKKSLRNTAGWTASSTTRRRCSRVSTSAPMRSSTMPSGWAFLRHSC